MSKSLLGEGELLYRQNYLHGKGFFENMRKSNKRPAENSIVTYESRWKHILYWAGSRPLTQAHLFTPSLREYVLMSKGKKSTEPISDNDCKIMEIGKNFFLWAKINRPKEYRAIKESWINDMVPVIDQEMSQSHIYVSEEEAIQIATFPISWENLPLKRAQALHALAMLTGARASALCTSPLKAVVVNDSNPRMMQWPELGVQTKNNKKGTSYFLPIFELHNVVKEWDNFLRSKLPLIAMWYPVIKSEWGDYQIMPDPPGKNRNQALADDFKALYRLTGMEYKSPHACRHGHAVYGLGHCRTMSEYQAISRNLMHSSIAITDRIYAEREEKERASIYAGLSKNAIAQPTSDLEVLLRNVADGDIFNAIHILSGRMAK